MYNRCMNNLHMHLSVISYKMKTVLMHFEGCSNKLTTFTDVGVNFCFILVSYTAAV